MKKITGLLFTVIFLIQITSLSVYSDTQYDENGKILSYSTTYNGEEKLSVPQVSKEQAVNIALEFISETCPEISFEIDPLQNEISHTKSYPYGYNIIFPRVINGILYRENNVSFFIDSKYGQIVSFTNNFDSNIVTEDLTDLIDIKTARNIYKSSFGLKLQYNKKIVNNKIRTYLSYTADDIIINASTQNTITEYYTIPKDGYFDVVNTAEKVSGYVDDTKSMSINRADLILRNMTELEISDDYSINSANYLKNYDGTYLISLLYKSGTNTKTATLNSTNGILVEYIDSSADIPSHSKDSELVAQDFADKYYQEYSQNFIKKKNTDSKSTVLLYERKVDDIPYKSNGLYIYCSDGKLKNISFAWDNIEFPSLEYLISEQYAYDQFFKKCDLELTYYKRDNGVLVPVYRKSLKGTGIFDAESGRQLGYDGNYYNNPKEIKYLDIQKHYSGNIAKKLADCDIYVSWGNVYLEDYITQQEFLLLISEFIEGTKPVLNTTGIISDDQSDMLYAYMFSNGILSRDEADNMAYVTRADGVKYLLRILGHGTVGDMSDIFIKHFADSDEIPQGLTGYVELARSLGLVSGTTDNKFKPNEYLTNGDSLIIIYNLLGR